MKINSGFINLSAVNFAAQVELIVTSLTGNANFPEPWPASVVTLAQLQADLASYQDAITAIATGDRRQVAARQAGRQKLAGELQTLAFYLQTVADGDATKLTTAGFPARKDNPRVQNPGSLPAPEGLLVDRGVLSGQIVVKMNKVAKAASYEVQTATADPTVETNWSGAGSYTGCRGIALDGLTPGKIYWVRVRALGNSGPGAWTTGTSVMVV
jgi:hypothetical protein